MSGLLALQRELAAAMLGARGAVPAAVAPSAIPAQVRLSVYRNNVLSSLRRVLEDSFTGTHRLLGTARSRELAARFVREAPPSCGWLSAYGAAFPRFLESAELAVEAPHIPDVARIEWLRRLAAQAPWEPPLDLAGLARLPSAELAGTRLRLARGVFLFRSQYAAFSYWARAHEAQASDADAAIPGDPEEILVARVPDGVCVERLGSGEFSLLRLLERGSASVLEIARAVGPPPSQLAGALAGLARVSAIVS